MYLFKNAVISRQVRQFHSLRFTEVNPSLPSLAAPLP